MHGVRSCALIYHQSVKKKWNFMSFHKPFQHCCNCSSCTIHNHFRCRVPTAQLSGSLEKNFFKIGSIQKFASWGHFNSSGAASKTREPGLGNTTITVQRATPATTAAATAKSGWDRGLASLTPYGAHAFCYAITMIWQIFWGNDQGKKLSLINPWNSKKQISICPLRSWAKPAQILINCVGLAKIKI